MCKIVEMSGPDFRVKSKRADWQPIAASSRLKVRGKKESG
jgi:hypothetical protein